MNDCSYQTKRYALDALDVNVVVTDDRVDIKMSVPVELTNVEHVITVKSGLKRHKRRVIMLHRHWKTNPMLIS